MMPFAKLSDDYSDDAWPLSDTAFRLHTEAIIWSARKSLDCRIPKADLHHFKRGDDRAALQELLSLGFWSDYGNTFLILHQSQYQRTRKSVMAQQTRNQLNGMKGGRPRSGGSREVWARPEETLVGSESGTQNETQLGSESETHLGSGGFQSSPAENPKIRVNMGQKNPHGNPDGNPQGMAFNRSSPTAGSSENKGGSSLVLDPDAWPQDQVGVEWREFCEERNLVTVEALMEAEAMSDQQARKTLSQAYPGREF